MKSIQRAHVVVVADSDQGLVLANQIRRMAVARVTAVAGLDEARLMCLNGGTDACVVAIVESVPDAISNKEADAPGRCCGVPSLMVVPVLTPYLRHVARRCGYLAAVPASIPQRLLYRRLGGALQRRHPARQNRRRMPGVAILAPPTLLRPTGFSKPTLH